MRIQVSIATLTHQESHEPGQPANTLRKSLAISKNTSAAPDMFKRKNEDMTDQTSILNEFDTEYEVHKKLFIEKQNELKLDLRDFIQELFITRLQGERFSLLTEIVRGFVGSDGIFPDDTVSEASMSESDNSSDLS